MTHDDEQALKEAEEFKQHIDKWHHDVTKVCKEKLRIKDGKIVSGVLWIGLKAGGKVKTKRAPAKPLQKWALSYCNKPFDYK